MSFVESLCKCLMYNKIIWCDPILFILFFTSLTWMYKVGIKINKEQL